MRFIVLVLASMAAACGGGGGGNGNSPPPPVTESITKTLVEFGEVRRVVPALPNQLTLVTSDAQLRQIAQSRFLVPASLASFDYSQGSVLYVEGSPDNDPISVVRVAEVTRTSGVDRVRAEVCGSMPRAPGTHRPFALYSVARVLNAPVFEAVSGVYDCPTARRIGATFVAEGGILNVNPPPPLPPTVIRTQAELDLLRAFDPSLQVPTPDFTQTHLLFFSYTSFLVQPYLRLMVMAGSADGSRQALVELCDGITVNSHFTATVVSVYSVPAFTGSVQQATARRDIFSGDTCVTTR